MSNYQAVRHPALRQTAARGHEIIVRRSAAIGDCLAASVVIDKLIDRGIDPVFQCGVSIHCVMRRHPRLRRIEDTNRAPNVNLDGAYEDHPQRRFLHFHSIFMEKANQQLERFGINLGPAINCKPEIRIDPADAAAAAAKFKDYPRPLIFICPRSDSYLSRQVPDGVWLEAAKRMNGTVFWTGRCPAPPGMIDLEVRHLDNLIVWLSIADLVVTVDTGSMHIAAAVGAPIVALGQSSRPDLHLNDQNDFIILEPAGLDCLNCQERNCPKNALSPPCQVFDPEVISSWTNAKLNQRFGDYVSCVIACYQPELETINRCLEAVLPQVQEVVIGLEANSKWPEGVILHPKIRIVRKCLGGIGYGRNTNHAARQTTGKYILFLNDDVFLAPDAVAKMRQCMTPETGAVANRLMYPDGTVYHAGKYRPSGARGWGHLNHRQREWDIKEPRELENVCGACLLVPRKAFYQINGFDEEFFLYSEDDDFALRLRQAGWKVMFTPHSEGVHLEHQSTKKLGDPHKLAEKGNEIMNRKWGWWFDKNVNTVPGTF